MDREGGGWRKNELQGITKGKKSTGKWFLRPYNTSEDRTTIVMTSAVAPRDAITSRQNWYLNAGMR